MALILPEYALTMAGGPMGSDDFQQPPKEGWPQRSDLSARIGRYPGTHQGHTIGCSRLFAVTGVSTDAAKLACKQLGSRKQHFQKNRALVSSWQWGEHIPCSQQCLVRATRLWVWTAADHSWLPFSLVDFKLLSLLQGLRRLLRASCRIFRFWHKKALPLLGHAVWPGTMRSIGQSTASVGCTNRSWAINFFLYVSHEAWSQRSAQDDQ